jgi:hypothetical protein
MIDLDIPAFLRIPQEVAHPHSTRPFDRRQQRTARLPNLSAS